MQRLDRAQIQQVLLGILKEADRFCRAHDIRYSLAGGTLLGALRHQGFIPWDDDADLIMPRPDYERFVALFNKEENSHYHLLTQEHNEDKWYVNCYSKLEDSNTRSTEWGIRFSSKFGINVDVFPVDGLPDDPKQQRRIIMKAGHLTRLVSLRQKRFSQFFRFHAGPPLAKIEAHLHSVDYWLKQCRRVMQAHDFETSPYAGALCGVYRTREVFPRTLFEHYKDYDFEGIKLRGLEDAETYLSSLYGNWRQLPPEDQREGKHHLEAYSLV